MVSSTITGNLLQGTYTPNTSVIFYNSIILDVFDNVSILGLEWLINDVIQANGTNFTYNFNTSGTYNITAKVYGRHNFNNNLLSITSNTLVYRITGSPCGMAFDPSGNIYLSYPLDNIIYKQNQLYFPTTSTIELNTPMGLCYLNNTLYIADWGNSRIVGYNGTTSTIISIPVNPYGLCVINTTIYICGNDSIYKFTPPNTSTTLVKQNSGSDFMFMCTDGNILYLCDSTSKSVRQYNTQTNIFVV